MAPALQRYNWILALTTIAFVVSSFGNGANDVANSYATSVAARTLTMPQVGLLSAVTEFVGAFALGSRVTSTIKNSIISISRFEDSPAVLMLAMGCAEIASATWLIIATGWGMPVSTTQTVVGALIGVGIASGAPVSWGWKSGSVSQIAASWGVAPGIAAGFAAILFATLKFCILERDDSFTKALRAIPFYLAFTCAVLALFMVVEAPGADSLEELGAGRAVGIVLGVFFGVLLLSYLFFIPYFKARLVKNDARLRWWHVPLGPLLLRENPPVYLPADPEHGVVDDYYGNAYTAKDDSSENVEHVGVGNCGEKGSIGGNDSSSERDPEAARPRPAAAPVIRGYKLKPHPDDCFLKPVAHLPLYHPKRIWGMTKWLFLQGVVRDVISHESADLHRRHMLAVRYDNKVEHLWTYAQVASAMLMSIAHGSNDVANAVGPWVASWNVYNSGVVESRTDTPPWILAVAGILLGTGFWFYGWKVMRSMGNRITQLSPTRGYSMELGAAITVLLASRLGLPISTTQTLIGATTGVALLNGHAAAVDWRHVAFIFMGWVLTLPVTGLFSGLLFAMAVNAPSF